STPAQSLSFERLPPPLSIISDIPICPDATYASTTPLTHHLPIPIPHNASTPPLPEASSPPDSCSRSVPPPIQQPRGYQRKKVLPSQQSDL
ncbi:hypothetical protein E4U59_005144, partial [Claviceps monticola]